VEPLTREQLEGVLREATDRLRREFGACRVYLFGSYAYGRPSPDSDLDFMVVVPDNGESTYELNVRAIGALSRLGVPKDVIVRTESEFQRRSHWLSSIENEVSLKGRLLHAA
jgi:predicted nucleotidyltransferase